MHVYRRLVALVPGRTRLKQRGHGTTSRQEGGSTMRVNRLVSSLLMVTLLTMAWALWAASTAAAQQTSQCFAETSQCVGGRIHEH